ncbi:hypothetical protein EIQ22_16130 [Xanthomonas campestris pv. campestris]
MRLRVEKTTSSITMLCRLFAGAALLDAVIRAHHLSWVTWKHALHITRLRHTEIDAQRSSTTSPDNAGRTCA